MDGHARVAVVDDDQRLRTLIQEELVDEVCSLCHAHPLRSCSS